MFGNLLKKIISLKYLLMLIFELKNKFLNILMTKSFNYGLNKIADAFQNRAEELFRNT